MLHSCCCPCEFLILQLLKTTRPMWLSLLLRHFSSISAVSDSCNAVMHHLVAALHQLLYHHVHGSLSLELF